MKSSICTTLVCAMRLKTIFALTAVLALAALDMHIAPISYGFQGSPAISMMIGACGI